MNHGTPGLPKKRRLGRHLPKDPRPRVVPLQDEDSTPGQSARSPSTFSIHDGRYAGVSPGPSGHGCMGDGAAVLPSNRNCAAAIIQTTHDSIEHPTSRSPSAFTWLVDVFLHHLVQRKSDGEQVTTAAKSLSWFQTAIPSIIEEAKIKHFAKVNELVRLSFPQLVKFSSACLLAGNHA